MTKKLIHIRTSASLRAVLDQAGPVTNAARALMLVGAYTVGLDLEEARTDLYTLIGCQDLAPAVRLALQHALDGGGSPSGSPSGSSLSRPPERWNQPVPVSQRTDGTMQGGNIVDDQDHAPHTGDWLLDGLGKTEV